MPQEFSEIKPYDIRASGGWLVHGLPCPDFMCDSQADGQPEKKVDGMGMIDDRVISRENAGRTVDEKGDTGEIPLKTKKGYALPECHD
jgi:hypothetical protein